LTKLDISKVASDNSLLAAMPLPDFALLVPHLKPFMPKQGEVLIEQESIAESVYFPLEGLFSLVTVMEDGSAIELGAVGNEYAIGLSEVLAPRLSIARAVVQVSGATLVVPADVVRRIALKCTRLRQLSLCCEQALLIQLAQTSACNALHSLECRLARWLLQTSDRVNPTSVVLTLDFMSQMLGVSRTA
jgi:CRP-like cAMP-binding protein